MMTSFRLKCAIAAGVAAVALAFPAGAQDVEAGKIRGGNPSCVDVVVNNFCGMTAVGNEYEITNVTTSGEDCDGDICTNTDLNTEIPLQFEVQWVVDKANGTVDVEDLTTLPPSLVFAAILAEGKRESSVYCAEDPKLVAISAPGKRNTRVIPTKITFCWAPTKPCLQTPQEVADACAFYFVEGKKSFIQATLVKPPPQPINVCSCFPDDFEATFCDPTLGSEEPGGCPTGEGDVSALANQGVATLGPNTCMRIVIGGRAFFIGDTCVP